MDVAGDRVSADAAQAETQAELVLPILFDALSIALRLDAASVAVGKVGGHVGEAWGLGAGAGGEGGGGERARMLHPTTTPHANHPPRLCLE